MPFKSQAQEKYFFANRDKLAKQGVDVKEWATASKGLRLPRYAPKRPAGFSPTKPKNIMGK